MSECTCKHCGKKFVPKQVYCSTRCRVYAFRGKAPKPKLESKPATKAAPIPERSENAKLLDSIFNKKK